MKDKRILHNTKYCTRCCMPETQEGITFDEFGICKACQSSEEKMHINWKEREKELKSILEEAKEKAGNNYDCILPISGGKDSFYQAHVLCKVYGMKPLAVTFSHNWYSETGYYNLQRCLEVFDLDHMMFTPNRKLVNKIAKRSLGMIGDTCWTCHAGIGAFPLQIACKFNIPLLIFGESIAESSGRASYFDPVRKYDREYFTKVSAKVEPKDMICEYLTDKDLYPFQVPSIEECEAAGVHGIHLGDFIFWDEERQTEFVRDEYGWKETDIEGAYKGYKSAECVMAGMHDFTCYLKRGYGRSTFQACVDIRKGLLTREQGFELASRYDTEIPESLEYYLEITGMSKDDFYNIMRECRHEKIVEELPLKEKTHLCKECRLPFSQQVIRKYEGIKDVRLT
ncbi:MAG: N-acetyl sugar amidotransferase [Lachnospiraceae bacterium]|nr:N-acetyl sugar amidotransferase [Lachnospiraceae bacterium]